MQNLHIIHNGTIKDPNSEIVSIENRAFQFGDGLFESICYSDNKILFLHEHFDRIKQSAQTLGFPFPYNWSPVYWEEQIHLLCHQNQLHNARIKILLYRAGSGTYTPSVNACEWIIRCAPTQVLWNSNSQSLHLDFYTQYYKTQHPGSQHKTLSALLYVLAAHDAKSRNLDDIILLSDKGHISECSSGNIFWVIDGHLYTPSLASNCLPGIMRKAILKESNKLSIQTEEGLFEPHVLENAEEVFICNAIKGIQSVVKTGKNLHPSKEIALKLIHSFHSAI